MEECIDVWNERFGTDTRGKPTKYRATYNDVATKVKMPTKRALFDMPQQQDDSMEEQKVDRGGGRREPERQDSYNQSAVKSPTAANQGMNQSAAKTPASVNRVEEEMNKSQVQQDKNAKNNEILKKLRKRIYSQVSVN